MIKVRLLDSVMDDEISEDMTYTLISAYSITLSRDK
jgi:hypothetical protein